MGKIEKNLNCGRTEMLQVKILAIEIANKVREESWTRKFFYDLVQYPEDITEILSLYLDQYGQPIPNSLKRGLAKAFSKFNKEQLIEHEERENCISLRNAIRLLHPKPVYKNREALRKLVCGDFRRTSNV